MTPEKEQIIQNEAKSWAVAMITGLPVTNEKAWEEIYKAIATKYAEKLEEKDKIIEYKDKEIKELEKQLILNEEAEIQFIKQLESKDRELAELKELLNYYKDKADKGEGILKSATDIHFVPGKEGDNLLAAKDREIEQLKSDVGMYITINEDLVTTCKKQDRELAQLKEIAEKVNFALRDLDLMLDIVDPQIPRNEIRAKVIKILELSDLTLNGANKT